MIQNMLKPINIIPSAALRCSNFLYLELLCSIFKTSTFPIRTGNYAYYNNLCSRNIPAEAATCAEFIPVSLMALTDRSPSSSMRIFDVAFWCLLIARSKQVKPEINKHIIHVSPMYSIILPSLSCK